MEILRFVAVLVFAFFIPGSIFLRPIALTSSVKIGAALALGMVLWGLQGFLLGFINFRSGTYLYLTVTTIIFLLLNLRARVSWPTRIPRPDWIFLTIVTVGVLFQVSAVWFIGTPTDKGLFFCCRGVPDDIYHLALTDQLVKNFPPYEPGAAGIVVKNYHYLGNLIMAETIRIFGTNLIDTTYKFFPLLISILLGCSIASFSRLAGLGKVFNRWLALFVFFGGDILFLLTFLNGRGINFNVNSLDDATKLLAGPPRAFSIVVIFWAICLLVVWIKNRNALLDIILALMFGSLAGLKLYTGIFAYIGLGFLGLFYFAQRDFKKMVMPLMAALVAALIYLPVNGIGNGLIFLFPWVFRSFIVKPELGLVNMELARRIFENDNKWWRSIPYDLYFAFLYMVFNFGTLVFGLFQNKKSLSFFPGLLHIFLIPGIFITIFLGFCSSSRIGGINTIQFIIAEYFFLSFYAALSLSYWQTQIPRFSRLLLIFVVVCLIVPKAVHEGVNNFIFFQEKKGFTVSNNELSALTYLRNETNDKGVVALSPDWADKETYMHVSFMSHRSVFLSGYQGVLEDHQIPGATQRRVDSQTLFTTQSETLAADISKKYNIRYLYLPSEERLGLEGKVDWLIPVYISPTVKIFRVDEVAI